MRFNAYQKKARETAIYPAAGEDKRSVDLGIIYVALKLSGEAGEIAEKIGKLLRDKRGRISIVDKTELEKELGDVLWYIANLATELGLELNDIASTNLIKLKSRQERGKLQGKGDNR